MTDFYLLTPRYVSLAAQGLLTDAAQWATKFSAETAGDAQIAGDEIASQMYMHPKDVDYMIVTEAGKMRIDGQPEFDLTSP